MASGGNRVVITGQDEVNKALNKVAEFNQEDAATEAANAILPAVRAGTRFRTGLLQSGWDVERGAFVNEVPYAVPQEFGSIHLEGSFATIKAFEAHEADVLKAFEDGIEDAAQKAGFDTK